MSARAGLALGGALVGGLFFGGVGARIGFTLGNFIGGQLFGDERSGPTVEGPRLGDLTVSASSYGSGIPITYGAVRVPGNMIWATDIVEVRHEESVSGGGGGGKSTPSPPGGTQVTYEYFANFAMAFCEGPVDLIRRVWADGKLLVDLTDSAGRSGIFRYGQSHYRMYLGDEQQTPDSLIEADKGAGNVPGHRGLVYVVFENLPLADFGNRIPTTISAEVVSDAPANFGQVAYNIQPGDHAQDATRLDFTAPFAVTSAISGVHITKFNRITGTEYLDFNTGDDPDLNGALTALGVALNVGKNGIGTVMIDPSIGDITIPLEGTTGQGGGFAVYDKNGKFITYRHLGSFGGPRSGIIFNADSGFSRVLVIGSGLRGNELRTFKWAIDPEDPTDPRGTLSQAAIASYTAPTNLSTQTYIDFAVDPTKGAERAWGIRGTTGTDGAPPAIVQVTADGAFGADTTVSAITSKPVGISYDTITDTLLVVTISAIYKLDPDTLAVIAKIGDGVAASDGGLVGQDATVQTSLMRNQPTVQGLLHFLADREPTDPLSSSNLVRVDTTDLSILARYNSIALFDPDANWTFGGLVWDPLIPALWSSVGGYIKYLFDRYGANAVPLSSILTDLSVRAGLTPADIDVSTITDLVRGYVIENPSSIRGAIEPLQQAFFFDGAEINFKLAYVKRGGASVATIPYTDLAAKTEGGEEEAKVLEPRRQEVEVPRRIIVSYLNPDNDYMISTQMEQRILHTPGESLEGVTQSRQETNYRLPIVLSDQEAREIASINLGTAWVERMGVEFKLPPKWMRLDPTDPVVVEKVSNALTADFNVRLTQIEMGEGGVVSCRAVLTDTAVFSPNVTATPGNLNPADPIPLSVGTEMFLLNLPNVRGLLDEGGAAWFAAAPAYQVPNPDWRGANLSRAEDQSGPFSGAAVVLNRSTWGLVKNTFGATSRWTVFDDVNTLEVELVLEADLQSVTDLQVFSGANLIYIESTGELLHFGVATQISATRWVLSHLLRGRYGTEHAIAVPARNDKVVFIDTNRMAQFGNLSDAGALRYYAATTIASNPSQTPIRGFINTAESLKPWSPVSVNGTRNIAGDLAITWLRRTRYNGELKDLVDVPLNEAFERYEVDIVAPKDRSYSSVVLLVPADGAATDLSSLAATPTIGSSTQVTFSPFVFKLGTGAVEFTPAGTTPRLNSNCFVSYPDNAAYTIGTNDFAIEMFVRFKSLTDTDQTFACHYDSNGNQRAWYIRRTGGNLEGFLSNDGTAGGASITITRAVTWAIDTWYHVAMTRDSSGNVRLFLDGVQQGASASFASAIFNSTAALYLGKLKQGAGVADEQAVTGFLDEVRFTNGAARYTANFTPPAEPFATSAADEVVIRTLPVQNTQTVTYTATQQTTDGFVGGDPIPVDVYQLSETVGRGHARRATL